MATRTVEDILEALQGIIDGAAAEERELTDEEVSAYEELEQELARSRRRQELERRHQAYKTPGSGLRVTKKDAPDDTLERAFDHYLRTGKPNADITELRAQSVGTDSAGGYTVPPGFRQKIVDRMLAYGGIGAIAEPLNTDSGNDLEWPTLDDTSNTGELVAENAAPASAGADLVFGTVTLGAFKYVSSGASHLPLKVPVELLQDSAFDLETLIANKLGERLARITADEYAVGDGSGNPLGLMTKAGYAAMASNAAGPTYAELLGCVHAVDPAYRQSGRCRWVMNDNTLLVIRGLLDANDRPLLQPANEAGYAAGLGETLLGYPITIDQSVPDIGDATKPIAFGDIYEAYVVRRVTDITVVRFSELYALNGQVGFTAWTRTDATIQNTNAYAILEAEDTA